MSSTFDVVAKVISETSEIPLDQITPESHAIDDLGIDSLDFLDIVFALDKKFGIKIPLESWTEEVNEGRAKVEDYFVCSTWRRATSRPRRGCPTTARCSRGIFRATR
jgi:acyl carrier protein